MDPDVGRTNREPALRNARRLRQSERQDNASPHLPDRQRRQVLAPGGASEGLVYTDFLNDPGATIRKPTSGPGTRVITRISDVDHAGPAANRLIP